MLNMKRLNLVFVLCLLFAGQQLYGQCSFSYSISGKESIPGVSGNFDAAMVKADIESWYKPSYNSSAECEKYRARAISRNSTYVTVTVSSCNCAGSSDNNINSQNSQNSNIMGTDLGNPFFTPNPSLTTKEWIDEYLLKMQAMGFDNASVFPLSGNKEFDEAYNKRFTYTITDVQFMNKIIEASNKRESSSRVRYSPERGENATCPPGKACPFDNRNRQATGGSKVPKQAVNQCTSQAVKDFIEENPDKKKNVTNALLRGYLASKSLTSAQRTELIEKISENKKILEDIHAKSENEGTSQYEEIMNKLPPIKADKLKKATTIRENAEKDLLKVEKVEQSKPTDNTELCTSVECDAKREKLAKAQDDELIYLCMKARKQSSTKKKNK
jgi:hypothetical protein